MLIILTFLLCFTSQTFSQIYEIPAYDHVYGTTFIDITVGVPGQVLFVEFDTGSFWTGLDCQFDFDFSIPSFYGRSGACSNIEYSSGSNFIGGYHEGLTRDCDGADGTNCGVAKGNDYSNSTTNITRGTGNKIGVDRNTNYISTEVWKDDNDSLKCPHPMINNDCDFSGAHFKNEVKKAYQASGSRVSEWVHCDNRCKFNSFSQFRLNCMVYGDDLENYKHRNYLREKEMLDLISRVDSKDSYMSKFTASLKEFGLDTLKHFPPKPISYYNYGSHLHEAYIPNLETPDTRENKTDNHVCYWEAHYADYSYISGNIFSDYLSFGDVEKFTPYLYADKMICGIHFGEYEAFQGILGSGRGMFNWNNQLVDKFFQTYSQNNHLFGVCMGWENNGGIITFGGYNPDYFITQDIIINWQKLDPSMFYQLSNITLGSNDSSSTFEVIVDTGSTFSIFPPDIYKQAYKQIVMACEYSNITYFEREFLGLEIFESKQLTNLPTLKFFKDGETKPFFMMEPLQYLRRYSNRIYILAIIPQTTSPNTPLSHNNWGLIGSLAMRSYYVLFDESNSSIAFVKSNCPSHYKHERVTNDLTKYFERSYHTPNIYLFLIGILLSCYPILVLAKSSPKIFKKITSGIKGRRNQRETSS